MKKALLLGEAPNSRLVPPSRWENVEAFQALPGSSGLWLRETLDSYLLEGWSFTLENSVSLHRVMHRFPGFKKIVALSKFVSTALQLPYVPHPGYWKRFRYHDRKKWILLLKIVLEESHGNFSPR